MAVEQFIDVEKFHEDIQVSDVNINDAFCNQASMFAYYAGLHFKAMRQHANTKIMRDTVWAKTELETREAAKTNNEKVTEGLIEARVVSDRKVIAATKDMNDAQAILGFINNALEAFKQRRDMLISLGANTREERKGEVRMRDSGIYASSRNQTSGNTEHV